MSIDFVTQQRSLPAISRDIVKQRGQQEIVDYLQRLVKILQEDILNAMITIQNNQLSLMNTGVYYFDLPDLNGIYSDGSIRLIKTGGGIELQQKVSGNWKTGTDAIARWEY